MLGLCSPNLQHLRKGDRNFSSRDDKSFVFYALFVLLLLFPYENSNNKFRLQITKLRSSVLLSSRDPGERTPAPVPGSADKER